jgi:heptosyltransferase-3
LSRPFKKIIISRTDAIGDVVLTLPMATFIKNNIDDCRIIFFGRSYTKPVIDCCNSIDEFLNYDTFLKLDNKQRTDFLNTGADAIIHVYPRSTIALAAKSARIKARIGTTNRIYHWTTCNKLIRLGRKNSNLHEAQLNFKLLSPLGISTDIALKDIPALYNFQNKTVLRNDIKQILSNDKFKLIVHPFSNRSAREWPLENYTALINSLPAEKFQVIVTGTEREIESINAMMKTLPQDVINVAGKFELSELISLISACDGLLSVSTGPLHIAAACGKNALGIYPPIRPMHPGRWAPVGIKAEYIVPDKTCSDCAMNSAACHCITEITANVVLSKIIKWIYTIRK